MGRTACCVVLVCALVLAGCSGFAGGGSGSGAEGSDGADPSTSVTPAPVPTTEGTETPTPQVAPGLSSAGVTNASALGAAHDATLRNTSHTIVRNVTYRAANGTVLTKRRTVSAIGADGGFAVTRTWEGVQGLAREETWSDGEQLLEARTDTNGTTTYRQAPSEAVSRRRAIVTETGGGQLERVLTVADVRVVDRYERNGTSYYRFASVVARQPGTNATDRGPTLRVEGVVGEGGLVRAYEFEQTFSSDFSGAASVVISTRYVNVGETRVARPSWYDTALRATDENETTNGTANGTQWTGVERMGAERTRDERAGDGRDRAVTDPSIGASTTGGRGTTN